MRPQRRKSSRRRGGGGEERREEERREKPGAAPPGEPPSVAGTFLNAPKSQPGKRDLEREEERGGRREKKKSLHEPGKRSPPPPTCGSPNWSLCQSLTLPGRLTLLRRPLPARPGGAQRPGQQGSPGLVGDTHTHTHPLAPPAPLPPPAWPKGLSERRGRSPLASCLDPLPCQRCGSEAGEEEQPARETRVAEP